MEGEQAPKKKLDFLSSDSDDPNIDDLLNIFKDPIEKKEEPAEAPKEEEQKEEVVNDTAEEKENEKPEFEKNSESNEYSENDEEVEAKPQEPEVEELPIEDPRNKVSSTPLGNAYLAQKLREKLTYKPKQELRLTADFHPEKDSNFIVEPPKKTKRQLLRKQMVEQGNKALFEEVKEDSSDEIMDEGEEEEEEEEEKKEEEKKEDEASKEIKEISNAIVEKLDLDDENKEMDEDELEKKIYQQVVDLRLSIDLEELKKIIRIVTGEWRSGSLKRDQAGAEAIEGSFEGNQKDQKALEEKRTMRRQRRQQKMQRIEKLTAKSIEELIQKAIYIQKANSENATEADKIRAQAAVLGDDSREAEILEKLEMEAYLKEKRVREVQEMRKQTRSNQKLKKNVMDIEQPILTLKSSEAKKKKGSFAFVPADRNVSTAVRFPEKVVDLPKVKPNKKLLNFISRTNSTNSEFASRTNSQTDL